MKQNISFLTFSSYFTQFSLLFHCPDWVKSRFFFGKHWMKTLSMTTTPEIFYVVTLLSTKNQIKLYSQLHFVATMIFLSVVYWHYLSQYQPEINMLLIAVAEFLTFGIRKYLYLRCKRKSKIQMYWGIKIYSENQTFPYFLLYTILHQHLKQTIVQ